MFALDTSNWQNQWRHLLRDFNAHLLISTNHFPSERGHPQAVRDYTLALQTQWFQRIGSFKIKKYVLQGTRNHAVKSQQSYLRFAQLSRTNWYRTRSVAIIFTVIFSSPPSCPLPGSAAGKQSGLNHGWTLIIVHNCCVNVTWIYRHFSLVTWPPYLTFIDGPCNLRKCTKAC